MTLSSEELRRFLRFVEQAASIRDQAIVNLLMHGLRVSEVVGLRVGDVHVAGGHGWLEIRGSHTKRSSQRRVPLNRQARASLLAHFEAAQPTDFVFSGQRGPLGPSGLDKLIRRLCAAAGLKAHAHTFRHQFAELFLRANPGQIAELQALLGHTSPETTLRHYARRRYSDLESGVERTSF